MRTRRTTVALLTLALAAAGLAPPAAAEEAEPRGPGFAWYLIGDEADVTPVTSPGYALMGGGRSVAAAFRWLVRRGGNGDVVVLRASQADEYNRYIDGLEPMDSVETIVFSTRDASYDPFVLSRIRAADALFIAGGDQSNYARMWDDTPVEDAIEELAFRGVPIGGVSAGLAILGEYAFTARKGTISSPAALSKPYHERMTVDGTFLQLPGLENLITDSHFFERHRQGRLVAFLARIVGDGHETQARGLGIDQGTAVLVEADGSSRVVGDRAAWFIETTGTPEHLEPRDPLTYTGLRGYLVEQGGTFDFATWTGTGGRPFVISAVEGDLVIEPA
jgi:cyanophycinase